MSHLASSLEDVDVRFCDAEPIRIPGSIQPHGVLLSLDPKSLEILQVSENIEQQFGVTAKKALGSSLFQILEGSGPIVAELRRANFSKEPTYLGSLVQRGRSFNVIAHSYDSVIIIEFESAEREHSSLFHDIYPTVNSFVSRLSGLRSALEVAEVAAAQVRELTQFDRVLVYQFDSSWNGTVIAESRNDELPSYLDLRFPASDIPAQARELYQLNPIRNIPEASYNPASLIPANNPKTGRPLDLSFSALRSVSPVHREYMRNMGTEASMSMSILQHGELWGLISCHNKRPRMVNFDIRKACEFIAQVMAVQTEMHEANFIFSERVRLKSLESEMLAHMAQQQNFSDGLVHSATLLDFANADGAAVVHDGVCELVGHTPGREEVQEIVRWLSEHSAREDVFHTDDLLTLFPEVANFQVNVRGLLAIRVSKLHNSYVLWFRPEVIQTVRWSGAPAKAGAEKSLHPRNSFDLWKETVRDRSLPFSQPQIEAAVELRNAIVGIVLRRAEELAQLSDQLHRSNQELEAFSYSVSHDLRAPFRHIVGYSELLKERETNLSPESVRYISNIVESAKFAGELVDHLLRFSRIGKVSLSMMRLSLSKLLEEVQRSLASDIKDRKIEWRVGPLPEVIADPIFLRLALFNLLSNSIKYTKTRETGVIEISSQETPKEVVICIRDNGVGFDMRYVNKLFGVFQRLHRIEDFEGTGIGLAIVRRIIERHEGRTWAEGEIDRGAAFYFSLPAIQKPEED